jgi:hypothetical protein
VHYAPWLYTKKYADHKHLTNLISIEEQKLDILPNPKKVHPTVTKNHEDSHSNNSKLSAKVSFWDSPDISSGIEKLFEVMGLYNKSKASYLLTSVALKHDPVI